jgi:hypothetical protein
MDETTHSSENAGGDGFAPAMDWIMVPVHSQRFREKPINDPKAKCWAREFFQVPQLRRHRARGKRRFSCLQQLRKEISSRKWDL